MMRTNESSDDNNDNTSPTVRTGAGVETDQPSLYYNEQRTTTRTTMRVMMPNNDTTSLLSRNQSSQAQRQESSNNSFEDVQNFTTDDVPLLLVSDEQQQQQQQSPPRIYNTTAQSQAVDIVQSTTPTTTRTTSPKAAIKANNIITSRPNRMMDSDDDSSSSSDVDEEEEESSLERKIKLLQYYGTAVSKNEKLQQLQQRLESSRQQQQQQTATATAYSHSNHEEATDRSSSTSSSSSSSEDIVAQLLRMTKTTTTTTTTEHQPKRSSMSETNTIRPKKPTSAVVPATSTARTAASPITAQAKRKDDDEKANFRALPISPPPPSPKKRVGSLVEGDRVNVGTSTTSAASIKSEGKNSVDSRGAPPRPKNRASSSEGDSSRLKTGTFTTTSGSSSSNSSGEEETIEASRATRPPQRTTSQQSQASTYSSPEALHRAPLRRTKSERSSVVRSPSSDGRRRSWSSNEHLLQSDDSDNDSVVNDNSLKSPSSPLTKVAGQSFPLHVEYRSEFDVGGSSSLPPNWLDNDGDDDDSAFAKELNCFGVVHVRVIRAQRLPCPIGSNVQAVIRLLPWKGKVRVEKAKSFSGPLEQCGVCVQWDEEEVPRTAMVHAYSDEDSPIPSIQIDLVFNPLGVFEFTMCSLTLSCKPLMRTPNIPKRQWFVTGKDGSDGERAPVIEVEAMFETVVDNAPTASPDQEGTTAKTDISESSESAVGPKGAIDRGSLDDSIVAELPLDQISSRESAKVTPADERSQLDSASTSDANKVRKTKQHLLRTTAYYTPATCCVCRQNLMSGLWKKTVLHCEECKVDCCDDCRLQVDVQLPCGSENAEKAVIDSIQNRLTLDKIMNIIAPFDDAGSKKESGGLTVSSNAKDKPAAGDSSDKHGSIGTMKLKFIRAHILEERLPPETDPKDIVNVKGLRVRPGDYYVRVTWTGSEKTVRTRTVLQSKGRPSLDSGELRFPVSHYGTEFRIECVDATTDKTIGTSLITTQGLLQQQRDYLIEEKQVPFLTFLRPIRFTDLRRIAVELRAGLKSGFSSDFFSPTKAVVSDNEAKPGDVVGCVELLAGFEEDLESLFGKNPYVCPPRPGEELNMSVFQLHLLRLSTLIEDAKRCAELYRYIVGWKNPLVTGLSLIVFVRLCMWYDPAYIGSFPVFLLILCMLFLAAKRSFGHARQKYIEMEIERNRKLENGSVDYDIHRPVGLLKVSIVNGRNIRSSDLGLPGNVACRVYWDPTRHMTERRKEKAIDIDESASAVHYIGSTNYVYSVNPEWEQMIDSEGSKRLKLLMPNHEDFFDKSKNADSMKEVEFPILQPITMSEDLQCLEPWSQSAGALVVEVHFSDLLNVLPGSEYSIGEVSIPFSDILKSGKISGWYNVTDVDGDATTAAVSPTRLALALSSQDDNSAHSATDEKPNIDTPKIYLTASWVPPDESKALPIERVREASNAIQEEMVRLALLSRQQKEKLGLLGSSIGALNSVRGISANLLVVQNTLGSILDLCESCIHAFDFTDPYKSFVLLGSVFILWLALSLVSTRVIIVTVGLSQYAITFKARFGRWMRSGKRVESEEPSSTDKNDADSPFVTWIMNGVRGLPTSEDLRRTYFWESRRLGAREMQSLAAEKRRSRMQRLWRVQWYCTVRILTFDEITESLEWRTAFVMLQGHRLLWWRSVGDFDSGSAPLGRLFLRGHAGIASPSPRELREISPEDVERVVCIFGSGARVTILTPSIEAKAGLEEAVEAAVSSKQD